MIKGRFSFNIYVLTLLQALEGDSTLNGFVRGYYYATLKYYCIFVYPYNLTIFFDKILPLGTYSNIFQKFMEGEKIREIMFAF